MNPWGTWETHELVQIYKKPPEILVIKIIIDSGEGSDGSLQFDEFRVQELVTRTTIEHR